VDSRPSDAIALAVRVMVPMYVEDAVMNKAGVALDPETGNPIIGGEPEEKAVVKMSEDELNRLSAFKEFIGGLDLEDFEKKQT
jgi:bifunctional DNase/RNase